MYTFHLSPLPSCSCIWVTSCGSTSNPLSYGCLILKGAILLLIQNVWACWPECLRSPILCLTPLDIQKLVSTSWRKPKKYILKWGCLQNTPARTGPLLLFPHTQERVRRYKEKRTWPGYLSPEPWTACNQLFAFESGLETHYLPLPFKRFAFIYVYICICVRLCTSSASTQVPAGHQMVPDLLELKLQVVVNHLKEVLGSESGSSARAVSPLNHWVLSPGSSQTIYLYSDTVLLFLNWSIWAFTSIVKALYISFIVPIPPLVCGKIVNVCWIDQCKQKY